MADRIPHDQLARDLANSIRTDRVMTWTDIQLGSSGSVRPDVYTINKSYVSPCPVAYECKVSVSDFRSDVTSGKWQAYLNFAGGVYFACEFGLIDKKDVPAHCGLIVRYPDTGVWRRAKKAVLNPITIPQDALIKLLIDGVEREGPRYRARQYSDSRMSAKIHAKFGETVARTVRDRLAVEDEIAEAQRHAEYIREAAEQRAARIRKEADLSPLREEICALLNLKSDTDKWRLENAVRKLREDIAQNPAQREWARITDQLTRLLAHHGYKEPKPGDEDED